MTYPSNRLNHTLVTRGLGSLSAEKPRNKSKYPQRGIEKSWRCKHGHHAHCDVLSCACECHDKEQM